MNIEKRTTSVVWEAWQFSEYLVFVFFISPSFVMNVCRSLSVIKAIIFQGTSYRHHCLQNFWGGTSARVDVECLYSTSCELFTANVTNGETLIIFQPLGRDMMWPSCSDCYS